MTCDTVDRSLDAYVDGELAPDAAAAMRAHVDACPACARRVAERRALIRLVQALPYYDLPTEVRTRVARTADRAARRSATMRRVVTLAAAAVLLIATAAGLVRLRGAGGRGEADDVVDSHVRSLMADHLFDVASTDQHTVKPWFAGRVDFSPPVTDLASLGFPLVGGRVDYLQGHAVAALVYQRRRHVINVFVAPGGALASRMAPAQSLRGFQVRHWAARGMTWWAVSDLNDAELATFVDALQRM